MDYKRLFRSRTPNARVVLRNLVKDGHIPAEDMRSILRIAAGDECVRFMKRGDLAKLAEVFETESAGRRLRGTPIDRIEWGDRCWNV